jgi:hypothetical protein
VFPSLESDPEDQANETHAKSHFIVPDSLLRTQ